MDHERGEMTMSDDTKSAKANGFFGSLKDALMAAGRDDTQPAVLAGAQTPPPIKATPAAPVPAAAAPVTPSPAAAPAQATPAASPSAEEAARIAKYGSAAKPADQPTNDAPPTTRVVRREAAPEPKKSERTQLVRGRQPIERRTFDRDPVVGFLVIVGGPGLGSFRPIFEGNNTLGRSPDNRIPLDFGDDTISSEAQAYVRYDSNDRSFLFVPNLAKTNVVSVNDKRPTSAVELKPMDVVTLGRTQVAFVPFCGADFDWSEITES
ncbi:MAG: hypothetical protein CTY31_04660 [Hyphomicrobium sp.]|nr:MAG: hypothetical protein CTY39_05775 [Hyphomicrobium sp.]PPD00430.1 MAG: hypothetical protein CTY31_04660 [Hyphomicrobium sp.]